MLSETVAQKPTTPVNDGMKNRKNSPKLANFEGVASIGPKPPALAPAQRSKASPITNNKGADTPCKNRIVSMPRRMTTTLRSQKKMKQTAWAPPKLAHDGASATIIALMASPPIQV